VRARANSSTKKSKAVSEIGRVLKVGGTAVIADHHPMAAVLGVSAIFQDKERFYRTIKDLR